MSNIALHLGYISILLLAAGLAFVVLKWPRGIQYTFSQHVTLKNSSTVFYSLLFLITLPLLFAFFYFSFVPRLHLQVAFTIILAISCITQILCTFLPERDQTRTKVHRILAGISAFCLPVLLSLLVTSSSVNTVGRITSLVGLLIMVTILYLAVFTRFRSTHALMLQIVYNLAFFLPILFIAYL